MKKACVFAILLTGFAASQAFAPIRIELPPPVAVSGTGVTLTTDFVGSDQVLVTVKPENPTEIAHYGFNIAFDPDEYQFVQAKGASVFWAEDGHVSVASSYILNGPNTEDMSIVLRKTGPAWGRLEPQGLDVFTRNRERKIYDPAPAFTPNPSALPQELTLWQNYPNPFNPETEIRFSVASEGPAWLAIYDAIGQKVRTLVSGESLTAGEHTTIWDATNDTGQPVSNGMYFYQLHSDGQTAIRKMILVK